MNKEINSTYRVQVLERALDILDCFGYKNRVLSLKEVTIQTGLNKTTVKRLLSNLVDRNYLTQEAETKKYRLGMKLCELGSIVLNSFSLRELSAGPMNQLRNETDNTVLLGVNVEEEMVYIDKLEGHGRISITSPIGRREPLHYGLLGQILMSELSPTMVDFILEKSPLKSYTHLSLTDPDDYHQRMAEIRSQGYLKETGEYIEGITGISTAIRDYSGNIVAAIGVAFPASQVSDDRSCQSAVTHIKTAATEISIGLGWRNL
ncbi:MAG: IclR family transcriptional regulator [Proteobacteria bacterium]|nr:IclR family transcriptional regulator [Pseudomonadota bacterium]